MMGGAAKAQVIEDLSCLGLTSRFTQQVNACLAKFEDKVVGKIDHAIQFLNFDKGNDKFAIQGGLNFSQLRIPQYDCKNPKKFFKSGAPDSNVFPNYPVVAKLFGRIVPVVTVGIEMGQDQRNADPSAPTPEGDEANADGVDGLHLSAKVFGIDVLNAEQRGPYVDAVKTAASVASGAQSASSASGDSNGSGGSGNGSSGSDSTSTSGAKTAEAAGNNQKLVDIAKSLKDYGADIKISLYVPGLFLVVNAGFTFSVDLTYHYGLDAGLFRLGKVKHIQKKKIDAPDSLCKAPKGGAAPAECEEKGARKKGLAGDFMTRFANSIQESVGDEVDAHLQNFKAVREAVQAFKVAAMKEDMKLVEEEYGHLMAALEMAPEEYKKITMASLNIKGSLRPDPNKPESDFSLSDYTREDYRKMAVAALNLYAALRAEFRALQGTRMKLKNLGSLMKNGIPAVTLKAGVGADVRLTAWVSVTLAYDLGVASLYAGIQGTLVPLDSRVTVGLQYATNESYIDLKLNTFLIKMQGQLSAIWGAKILSLEYNDSYPIASFPGYGSRTEHLLARVSLKGNPQMYWCTQFPWVNNPIDSAHCEDGAISTEEVDSELANHLKFREVVLGEPVPNEKDTCFLRNASGEAVFSTSDNSLCAVLLPSSATASLTPINGAEHPLVKVSAHRPELFMTQLRDAQNRPYIRLDRVTAQSSVSTIYSASQMVPDPLAAQPDAQSGGAQPLPELFLPESPSGEEGTADTASSAPPIERRILTATSYGAMVQGADGNYVALSSTNPAIRSSTDFHIKYNDKKVFVMDLPALKNSDLIQLGRDFKLGLCQVRGVMVGSVIKDALYVKGAPFPIEGEASGIVEVNRVSFPELGCGGALSNEDYLACQLRTQILENQCFPPERITQLIALGNLSNSEVIAGFMSFPKRIGGNPVQGQAQWAGNETYHSSAAQTISLGNNVYNAPCTGSGSNCISLNTTDQNSLWGKRAQISSVFPGGFASCANQFPIAVGPSGGYYVPPGFSYSGSSTYTGSGAHWWMVQYAPPPEGSEHFAEYKLYSRDKGVSIGVVGDAPSSPVYLPSNSTGNLPFDQIANEIKLNYHNPISVANESICDLQNNFHLNHFFETQMSNFKSRPIYSGEAAKQLAHALRQCVVDGACSFHPESRDVSESACRASFEVNVNGESGEFLKDFPEASGATSLSDCMSRVHSFQDPKFACRTYSEDLKNAVTSMSFWATPGQSYAFPVKVKVKLKYSAFISQGGANFAERHDEQQVAECRFDYVNGGSQALTSIENLTSSNIGLAEQRPGVCQLLVDSAGGGGSGNSVVETPAPVAGANTVASALLFPDLVGYDLEPVSETGAYIARSLVPNPDQPLDDFEQCKKALGFNYTGRKVGSLMGAMGFNDFINSTNLGSVCTSFSNSDALELRKRFPMLPDQQLQSLGVKVKFIRSDGAVFTQNLGSCEVSKQTLGDKISKTSCFLRAIRTSETSQSVIEHLSSSAGKAYEDLAVNLPGITASEGTDEYTAQAFDQYQNRDSFCKQAIKDRLFPTTSPSVTFAANRPSGNLPETCSSKVLQRVEINNLGGGSSFTAYPVLNGRKIGASYACGGTYQSPTSLLVEGANSICKLEFKPESTAISPLKAGASMDSTLSANTSFPAADTANASACHSSVTNAYMNLGMLQDTTHTGLCMSIEPKVATLLHELFGNGSVTSGLQGAQFNGLSSQTWSNDPTAGIQAEGVGNVLTVKVSSRYQVQAAPVSLQPVATCQYRFKEIRRTMSWTGGQAHITKTFAVHPVTFEAPLGSDLADAAAVAAKGQGLCLTNTVRDPQTGLMQSNSNCMTLASTDRTVLGGAALNAIQVITDPSMTPDAAYYEQLCSTRLYDLEPVPESIQPDVSKRYPLYLVSGNASAKPSLASPAAHYCRAPVCELRAGFGYHYVTADSSWRAKGTTVPRTFDECITYYAGKYQDYCDQVEFLRQLPRNMPIEMAAKFDELTVRLGSCSVSKKSDTPCRIVAQNISARTSSTNYQVFKEMNLNQSPIISGDESARINLIKRENSLEECRFVGSRFDRDENLCAKVVPGLPVLMNQPYEIAARMGEMSLAIRACPPPPIKPSEEEIAIGVSSVDPTKPLADSGGPVPIDSSDLLKEITDLDEKVLGSDLSNLEPGILEAWLKQAEDLKSKTRTDEEKTAIERLIQNIQSKIDSLTHLSEIGSLHDKVQRFLTVDPRTVTQDQIDQIQKAIEGLGTRLADPKEKQSYEELRMSFEKLRANVEPQSSPVPEKEIGL
jgi:hypothetical protein